jgi:aspartate oxidase
VDIQKGEFFMPRSIYRKEMTKFMVEKVKEIPNITAYEHTKAVELNVSDGRCCGQRQFDFD